MDRPVVRTEIREFPGMAQDMDPHDSPEGLAREMVNLESKERGTLKPRRGYRKVSFEG
jgi:hypothetical protein